MHITSCIAFYIILLQISHLTVITVLAMLLYWECLHHRVIRVHFYNVSFEQQ